MQSAQERGDINPDLDPEAVARVFTSLFDGLLFQQAMDRDVVIRSYVAVVKAMGSGLLWRPGELEGPDSPASPSTGPHSVHITE